MSRAWQHILSILCGCAQVAQGLSLPLAMSVRGEVPLCWTARFRWAAPLLGCSPVEGPSPGGTPLVSLVRWAGPAGLLACYVGCPFAGLLACQVG